jgi:hypothetical protein
MAEPSDTAASDGSDRDERAAVETLEDAARETVRAAGKSAREAGQAGMAAGAERIESVAHAVRDAAERFDKDLPSAAAYVRDAAEGLERASSVLRERSIEDAFKLAENFARRQPAAFFGASVLAGFVLARFLKSTAEAPGEAPPAGQPATPAGGPDYQMGA